MRFGLSHWLKKRRLISKYLIDYIINTQTLFHKGIYLSNKNMSQNLLSMLKSNYYNLLQTIKWLNRRLRELKKNLRFWQFLTNIKTL